MDLPLRFFVDGELYVLAERRDPWHDAAFKEVGRWEAEKVLADALASADASVLRRAALQDAWTEAGRDDRDGLGSGLRARLCEALDHLVLLRRRKPRYTLVLTKPEVVELGELEDLASATDEPTDTWVEVLVVDDANRPMAGVEYEIELSDGRVERGRTDEHGLLRYEDLPSGSCKVRLLGVDASGWDVA